MSTEPLFRAEAVQNRTAAQSHLADVVLARPLSFTFLTILACMVACSLIAFFVFGSYTKRTTATGLLVPDAGLIKVHATQLGTITQKHVREGQHVRRGDVMYVISSERRSTSFGGVQQALSESAQARIQSLQLQIESLRALLHSEQTAANTKLAGLRAQAQSLSRLISGVDRRVQLAEERQRRYDELRSQGFVSQEQYLTAQADALDQRTRLDELELERGNLRRQISDQESVLETLPTKYQAQIAELERAIVLARQDLTESETRRRWEIVAPESGVATAVIGEQGQTVDPGRPLLSIVPANATLQAQLYAPSSAVGFVTSGAEVNLRFHAYPYQKFGHHRGRVMSVSRTSASAAELIGVDAVQSVLNKGEPLYRITVQLSSQSVLAYGEAQPLQAGMLVDADLLQDTRRLYEWILEPLLTLKGRIS